MNSSTSSSEISAIQERAAGAYLRRLLCVAAGAFGVLWVYIAAFPMAVLDHQYPVWQAKRALLNDCDLGSLIVLGDSRIGIGAIPALLPMKSTNLAFEGGSTIEAFYAAQQALACPTPPQRVVLAFSVSRWNDAEDFWNRTVRLGLLSRAQLQEVVQEADLLGDPLLATAPDETGLPMSLRGLAAAVRFPPVYFSSLVNSGAGYRYVRNRELMAEVLRDRGQHYFPFVPGPVVGGEAAMTGFHAAPLLARYFDRLLALLNQNGVQTDIVLAPVSEATLTHTKPAVWQEYTAFLADHTAGLRTVQTRGPMPPHWPDRFFGDSGQHMGVAGATAFSRWLGACVTTDACETAWPVQVTN